MALQTVGWLQNAGAVHTAAQFRMYHAMLMAGNAGGSGGLRARGGVHSTFGAELAVTQTGSPSMGVLVDTGMASVPGSENATQGNYYAVNDAQVTLSVTAAHASLARIDIVVINVRDAFYSGVNNDIQLQVIAGTPASSPVAPSAPNNAITLAQIAVGAGVTSITNANITDVRFFLASAGGVIRAKNDSLRPASFEIGPSQLVWSNDVGRMYLWDGAAYQTIYPGYNKLGESILGSPAASVTFSSISSAYSSLRILAVCRSDTAATATTFNVRFNGDTGANYGVQSAFGQAASTGAAENLGATSITIPDMAAASATANHPGSFALDIPGYVGTTFVKLLEGVGTLSLGTATSQLICRKISGRWGSTAAINSVTLLPGAGNFITGSRFYLFGLP